MNEVIVIFAKEPRPGRVKTRLSPELNPESASILYEGFLKDVLTRRYQEGIRRHILAYWPKESEATMARLSGGLWELMAQEGEGLGERMGGVFRNLIRSENDSVLITNSDSPDLPNQLIENAFDRLREHSRETVFGPDSGGGYYLVGQRGLADGRIFDGVTMGERSVLENTLARCNACGIGVHLLDEASDVDTHQDLLRLVDRLRGGDLSDHSIPETSSALRRLGFEF